MMEKHCTQHRSFSFIILTFLLFTPRRKFLFWLNAKRDCKIVISYDCSFLTSFPPPWFQIKWVRSHLLLSLLWGVASFPYVTANRKSFVTICLLIIFVFIYLFIFINHSVIVRFPLTLIPSHQNLKTKSFAVFRIISTVSGNLQTSVADISMFSWWRTQFLRSFSWLLYLWH